jgi:hypothetical protein
MSWNMGSTKGVQVDNNDNDDDNSNNDAHIQASTLLVHGAGGWEE